MAHDVAESSRPVEVARSAPLGGDVEAITALGNARLVVGLRTGALLIVERDDLTVVAELDLPGPIEAVAVGGFHAYVAAGPAGLRVVDLADPARPREIATAADGHRVLDVALAGERAYLAAADAGLIVIDVRDPSRPARLGDLETDGYAFGVAVTGEHLLLADGWAGLRVIDVTDSESPEVVGTTQTVGWAMAVTVDGARAAVAAGRDGAVLFDVRDPDRVGLLGEWPLPAGHATAVSLDGDRLAVLDETVGYRLIRVAESGTLSEAAVLGMHAGAGGVALVEDRAFMADGQGGLLAIDVSTPSAPAELFAITTVDTVTSVSAVDERVYFWTRPRPGTSITNTWSMFAMDASTPSRPDVQKPVTHRGVTRGAVSVSGSLMAIAAEGGLWLVDVSDVEPCELSFLATRDQEDGFEVASVVLAGGHAYVSDGVGGDVIAIDVADPRTPTVVGRSGESPDRVVGGLPMLAVGTHLYTLAGHHDGFAVLAIFDISEPDRPRRLGWTELPAPWDASEGRPGQAMAYADGRLFLADGAAGLLAIDVSDPQHPRIAGRARLSGDALSVAVRAGVAYVATDGGGLHTVAIAGGAASGAVPAGEEPTARLALAGAGSDADDEGGSEVGPVTKPPADAPPSAPSGSPDPGSSPPSEPKPGLDACTVRNTEDNGAGSLRDCLERAGSGAVIDFDADAFPPGRPTTIGITFGLTVTAEDVVVDAGPAVPVIDGLDESDDGIIVEARGVTIRGVRIVRALGCGIRLENGEATVADNVLARNDVGVCITGGADNRVTGNLIGLAPSGAALDGTQSIGVIVSGTGNVVGGPSPVDRNVISGNGSEIVVQESVGSRIEGNYIGTDIAGRVALRKDGERAVAIVTAGAATTVVGNLIAGELTAEDPGSSYNAFVGNVIGFDVDGRPFDCSCGIGVAEPWNRIGGSGAGEGNRVNGTIYASTDTFVLGNEVGAEATSRSAARPAAIVLASVRRAVVGGSSSEAANTVFGGVQLLDGAAANLILGNDIRGGMDEDRRVGIRFADSSENRVIGNRVASTAVGVELGSGAEGNVVRANLVRGNGLGVVASAGSARNEIVGNTLTDNGGGQARDDGDGNRWDDGVAGNTWSDWQSPDADQDGVVDVPRPIAGGADDRLPLVAGV